MTSACLLLAPAAMLALAAARIPEAAAQGAPLLVVARPRIAVRAVEPDGEDLRVEGRLLDDRGEPLADRPVWVQAGPGERRRSRTGPQGDFGFRLEGAAARQLLLELRFEGERLLLPASRSIAWDPERPPLLLLVHWPRGRFLAPGREALPLEATASLAGERRPVRVRVLGPGGERLGGGSGVTGEPVRLLVRPAGLERPGLHAVQVVAEAGEQRAEQRALLALGASVRLRAWEEDRPEGSLVHAELRAGGQPLQGRPLALRTAEGEHLATGRTDAAGRVAFRLGAPGPTGVRVRFDGEPPLLEAAEAAVALGGRGAADGEEERRLPWWWAWTVPLALGLLWPLLERWRRRAARTADLGDAAREASEETPRPAPRWRPAEGGRGGRSRRRVRLRACDRRDRAPVTGVEVSASGAGLADGPVPLSLEPDGWLAVEPPGRGTLRLRLEAPGYVPEQFELRIPHDGAWDGAVVSLERVRDRLERGLEPLGRRLLGRAPSRPWERATFGELRALALRRGGEAGVEAAKLLQEAERLRYGPGEPALARVEALLGEARRLAERLGPPPPRALFDGPRSTVAVEGAGTDNGVDGS